MSRSTITNTGIFMLSSGDFASGTFWMGMLTDVPAGAHNPDLATVADLLAVTGVTEVSGGGYARQVLTGLTIVKDDTNDWVTVGADDVDFGIIAGGTGIGRAIFVFKAGGSDATRSLAFVGETQAQPFNGGAAVVAATVLFRVQRAT